MSRLSTCGDLGYWDGKPYPLTGSAVIMLPVSVLERFSREQVEETVKATLPMGSLSVIRYYIANTRC